MIRMPFTPANGRASRGGNMTQPRRAIAAAYRGVMGLKAHPVRKRGGCPTSQRKAMNSSTQSLGPAQAPWGLLAAGSSEWAGQDCLGLGAHLGHGQTAVRGKSSYARHNGLNRWAETRKSKVMNSSTRTMLAISFFASLPFTAIAFDYDTGGKRMAVGPGQGGCFAIVIVINTVGMYHEIERLETERGFVSIEYETIGGHNPDDHDIVTVRNLPDGVFADPMRMELPDGDTGEICLFEGVVS